MARPGIGGRLLFGLFGTFLMVTVIIAALAAITVLWPHGVLVDIWSTKQTEYHQLLRTPLLAGGGFAMLSVVLTFAAVGWFTRRWWAWPLVATVLGVNLLSDVVHMILTRQWIDAIGVLIEALVLLWVTSRPIRNRFERMHTNNGSKE